MEVVRVRITLACTECKQRNYNMTKDKKTHPDRMETKKYCQILQETHITQRNEIISMDSCKGSGNYGRESRERKL